MNEELKVIISAEIAKFKQGIKDAKKQMDNFTEGSEKGASKMDDAFKKAGEGIKGAYANVGKALAAVGASLIATSATTTEYRENMTKLNTAFQSVGGSANIAKKTYNELYKVLGESDVAVEASNHLAQMTTNQKSLSEWTNICKGVYATFGDSLPIEGLTESANETAKVGQVTGSLADAINWAKISNSDFGKTLSDNDKAMKAYNKALKEGETREDAFNVALSACSTEAEREKLIRETLNGVYDKASETYEKNNGKLIAQREAQAKLQETLATVGEAIQPVITAFTNFATQALELVTPYIQSLAENYMPQLQEALSVVAETLGKVMGFLVDNWAIVLSVAGVIAGITLAIGLYNTVAAVKAAMDALQVTTLGALIAAYAAQAVAMMVALAPYLLIVAAIAAVIAIIVLCIKHWDKIKATVTNVAKIVKEKVVAMVNAVKEKFNAMKTAIGTVIDNIKSTVSAKFNAVKTTITTIITAIKSVVSTIFGGIKTAISTVIDGIKTHISLSLSLIKAIFSGDFGAVKGIVSKIFNNIKDTISKVLNTAKNTVKSAIDKIKGFFNFSWKLPKLKLPHISIKGKFSIDPPSVPKFSVSWHKLGGVFDKPTLFNYGNSLHGLGEDGAEAIVPLEKNTQWMDKLATMLSDRMCSGTPIVLQVDGKTFAQTSINSINQLTKQQGRLGLNLV